MKEKTNSHGEKEANPVTHLEKLLGALYKKLTNDEIEIIEKLIINRERRAILKDILPYLENEIRYLTQLPTTFQDVKHRINHLEFIKKGVEELIKKGLQ